jgi:hypothetical protein
MKMGRIALTVASGLCVVISDHWLGMSREFAQIASYCAATFAAGWGLWTYRSNSQRERAKWAVQLYEKFYEGDHYKAIRDKLDCASDAPEVAELVTQEAAAFTDYLNFFEMVTFLADTRQLSKKRCSEFIPILSALLEAAYSVDELPE